MRILMMTNTFTPHVGGVARSVESFAHAYRERGHHVLVVAPEYEGARRDQSGIIRVPAIQKFNGSDFAVALPLLRDLSKAVTNFRPEVVHSHHPFLLGGTAVRISRMHGLPLVFTHHTMYEDYTHYVPVNSETLKRFVISLSTHYANLCDLVFAPSESVREILRHRGVQTPIAVVPTGVYVGRFRRGSRIGFRSAMAIPRDAFLVGHVGRLAHEKNLEFLAQAVAAFMQREKRAHFLVVGKGPAEKAIRDIFANANQLERVHFASTLQRKLLVSSYKAMDVFAFTSKSETQGVVLVEAMAGGVPVVALDANGTRDVIVDQRNGCLVGAETIEDMAAALQWVAACTPGQVRTLRLHARRTAERYTMERTAGRAIAAYGKLVRKTRVSRRGEQDLWTRTRRRIRAEWNMIVGVAEAAGTALAHSEP
ncbi:MAG: glycosyltransferase [Chromatiales bacterium]